MKKALAACLICLALFVCAYADTLTVGTDLPSEEIRDFYYTYNWIGYNAEYHRYRFFAEDGKHFFFHETRLRMEYRGRYPFQRHKRSNGG